MRDLAAASALAAPPPKVHVVVKKEDIDPARLAGRVVIVLDILFATTTIVTALDAGATSVIPAETPDEARCLAASMPADSYAIAGEDHLASIPGFATPLPLELTQTAGFGGKPLIYSTTNGTVALRHSHQAAAVYAAALLNVQSTLDHIARNHPGKPLVIVCAGSAGALNLEDFYGAGCFIDRLALTVDPTPTLSPTLSLDLSRDMSDTALSALAVFRAAPAYDTIAASRIGRIIRGVGGEREIRHAAQIDSLQLVAMLESRGGREQVVCVE